MDRPNPSSSSSPSVRVLTRPPPPATSISNAPPQNPSSLSSSSTPPPPPLDGVVVVGFLGSRASADTTHLVNKILDADVFGSAGLDRELPTSDSELRARELEWFRHRRISYHYEAEKGMVFLQFSSSVSPLELLSLDRAGGENERSVPDLETCEAEDLRGMLFVFSVCHVIIFLHEGLRFDTQILKKFRMLQAAKHALAPFVRSQITPTFMSKSPSSLSLPTASSSSSVSPGRHGRATGRHGSAISLMSGTGSHPSMLPGCCTPVTLFVFNDDYMDGSHSAPSAEDLADASSLNQHSNVGGLPRTNLTLKGSGSVVMLARPVSKTEGSFRKKLHSSLETQVRFLIKKCRTLIGTEPSHLGSRGVGNVSSLPLFSLDASRVAALLDRSIIQRAEALDFVTVLMEDALNSKSTLDMFSLEKHCQTLNHEDIQLIKDFIYRQYDMLRGRGSLPSNANSGSAAGVGMAAAAAAAAAASAAAGKPVSAPELPSLENWLSSSNLILNALLSIKSGFLDETGSLKELSLQRSANGIGGEKIPSLRNSGIEAAISCLESSKGLNMKYSISWCQRALPLAKEVYLQDLPPYYPTALHKAQLEKALEAFHSMVKGPALQMFSKKLEDECTSIWESGRQQCDAVSLTGKPCMHQRHEVKTCGSTSEAVIKEHSSGYVFLHACACGRSRRLRDDPFDFDSANITFNCFANCEDLLPTVILPVRSNTGSSPLILWRLMRLGGAKYYKPLKGLLQTGFFSTEKYLSKWTISLMKQQETSNLSYGITSKFSVVSSTPESKAVSAVDDEMKKSDAAQFQREVKPERSDNQRKKSGLVSRNEPSISFGKGLPSFTMKKPFSEVVAGGVATDSTFPALQPRKQAKGSGEIGARQVNDQTFDRIHVADDNLGSQRTDHISVHEKSYTPGANTRTDGNPFLQIGSNIVPVNISSEKMKPNNASKQVIVYVGFEHECSYGHRFLLSPDHLKELDSMYSSSEELNSSDDSGCNTETKNTLSSEVLQRSWGTMATALNNAKKHNRSTEPSAKYGQQNNGFNLFSRSGIEMLQPVHRLSVPADSMEKVERNLPHVKLDDGGSAFSLLNRKLPVYMNCWHCKNSSKQEHQKIKFASTVSQLQRIFLVTPPLPTVLATSPVVQFEDSSIPLSIPDHEQQLRFGTGCRVILPPESFLTLRLPFVYGVREDDGSLFPLKYLEKQPELTAWLVEGTTLQVVSMGHEYDEEIPLK